MTIHSIPGAIGIMGGGQLGRMTAIAAANLGIESHVYTDHENSPASYVARNTIVAPYTDKGKLVEFAKSVDVITFEFENIPSDTILFLESLTKVCPNWKSLHISQNRIREKDFLNEIGVKTAKYVAVSDLEGLKSAYAGIGPDCILKTVEMGYDGKGQFCLDKDSDLQSLWDSLPDPLRNKMILEEKVDFRKEISVISARSIEGDIVSYEPSWNIHKNGILDTSTVPADISEETRLQAQFISAKIARELDIVGLVAVEFFLTNRNILLVNEIAARPHNSGHWTMEACITNQFEQLVRAVCGMRLGDPSLIVQGVEMKNLIGEDVNSWQNYAKEPFTKVHLYGKKEVRAGRKMGHVNKLIV